MPNFSHHYLITEVKNFVEQFFQIGAFIISYPTHASGISQLTL